MTETINTLTSNLATVFSSVDDVINDWKGDGNLQFPALMSMLSVRNNWSEKEMREYDPLVRYYIRNNPEWHVTRGAKGGIMKASVKQEKEAARRAKEELKAKMKANIESGSPSSTEEV